MNQDKRIILLPVLITSIFLFCLSTPLWAQPSQNSSINDYLNYYSQRQKLEETHWDWHSERQQKMHQEAIEAARYDHQRARQQIDEKTSRTQQRRSEIVTKTLDETIFKINTGYMFVRGEQTFRLPHPNPEYGGNLSKLTYPIKGGMGKVDAEVKIAPRLFLGGRYASSSLKNTTSKDEDWNFAWKTADWGGEEDTKWLEYQLTEQNTKNKAHLWNANLYYRMFDWDDQDLGYYLSDFLRVERLHLDTFAGYQYYRGQHTMVDPTTKKRWIADSKWWQPIDPAPPYYDGLNSSYEVTYKGPRIGVRLGGSFTKKLYSSLSLSYAWVKSNADAYWNLRDFTWQHRGKSRGSAFNLDFETEYYLTSSWFLGGGFHYMWKNQKKSSYSGQFGPAGWPVQNQTFSEAEARNTRLKIFGISLKTGYRW